MDCKRFIQLVEEKKKRALEKKEAHLKWEQKLESAAMAKADPEAKERKLKAAKNKRRSTSNSEIGTDSESDDCRKSKRRAHKKHRRHVHSDSGDNGKKRERKYKRKPRKQYSDYIDDSSDAFESDLEEARKRKKRNHRRHGQHNSRSDSSESNASSDGYHEVSRKRRHAKHSRRQHQGSSDSSSDEDTSGIRRRHSRHHGQHSKLESSDSVASTDDDRRSHARHPNCNRRSGSMDARLAESYRNKDDRRGRSVGKSSDDNIEEADKRSRRHKKPGNYHDVHQEHWVYPSNGTRLEEWCRDDQPPNSQYMDIMPDGTVKIGNENNCKTA